MIRYKHTQFGWVIVLLLLLAGAVILIVAISNKEYEHLKVSLLPAAFIIFSCLMLFHSLTAVVTNENVKVYFASGLISKTIPLEKIIGCSVLKNKLVAGWGIRIGIGFTLWNVSGLDSVELTFKDKNWKFRIGTDKPEELFQAITSAIKEHQLSEKTG
ncbi:MAG: hypothetical protein ACHQHP_02895 [Bacteroidia bacterium]